MKIIEMRSITNLKLTDGLKSVVEMMEDRISEHGGRPKELTLSKQQK